MRFDSVDIELLIHEIELYLQFWDIADARELVPTSS
jgi:hypothetical protein